MINATDAIKKILKERAHDESRPFCYSDYITVKVDESGSAFCPKCGSDDLMRELKNVGVEYGYEWIMEHIVETEGERVDVEEIYRDLLDECYPVIKFGELGYSPSHVLELVDPTAFRIGVSEYADCEVEDGRLIELNGTYYRLEDITD
jgi:predicted RNA-binding Zn-ribbon protein involved in translation (DUF1610 family)